MRFSSIETEEEPVFDIRDHRFTEDNVLVRNQTRALA